MALSPAEEELRLQKEVEHWKKTWESMLKDRNKMYELAQAWQARAERAETALYELAHPPLTSAILGRFKEILEDIEEKSEGMSLLNKTRAQMRKHRCCNGTSGCQGQGEKHWCDQRGRND